MDWMGLHRNVRTRGAVIGGRLAKLGANPLFFILGLTFLGGLYASTLSDINDLQSSCLEERLEFNQRILESKLADNKILSLKIYKDLIRKDGGNREALIEISANLSKLENDVRSSIEKIARLKQEYLKSCEELNDPKWQVGTIYLLITTLLAAYAFWAGGANRKEKTDA